MYCPNCHIHQSREAARCDRCGGLLLFDRPLMQPRVLVESDPVPTLPPAARATADRRRLRHRRRAGWRLAYFLFPFLIATVFFGDALDVLSGAFFWPVFRSPEPPDRFETLE